MKKVYKISLLLLALIFLTTYNPSKLNILYKKNHSFLKVKKIEITNHLLVNKDDILEKLSNIYGKNILFLKKKDIKDPIKSINFLDKIEVKKKYPNTILIKIYETKPIAVLFEKKNKYFIDNSSNLIPYNEDLKYLNLPSIFGKNAQSKFIEFFTLLKNEKFPIKTINSFYYFQIDRWDIELSNKKIIKFPPERNREAIRTSIKLLDNKEFTNYNIIDLRINGKIIAE